MQRDRQNRDTAYEVPVEIIKDYAEVKNDILDVLSVIERDDNYQKTVDKVRIRDANELS